MTECWKSEKECQYCGTTLHVEHWVPGGCMCPTCKKAIRRIREEKLGFKWLPRGKKDELGFKWQQRRTKDV
jgi:hypothetical protein